MSRGWIVTINVAACLFILITTALILAGHH